MDNEVVELYRKYRPRTLKDIIGQPEAVGQLTEWLDSKRVPKVILLSGPSGTGKTTIARILKAKLGCNDLNFIEINCADSASLEMVRQMIVQAPLVPMGGKSRIWYLDEAQAMSRVHFAQQAMLKLLEDVPRYAYYFLATTDPGKLHDAIRTRCSQLELKPLSGSDLTNILLKVAGEEGKDTIPIRVLNLILEEANGSARAALVSLHKVLNLEEKEALEALQPKGARKSAWDITKYLIWQRKPTWKGMASILNSVEENADDVRKLVMASASKELLKAEASSDRAAKVLMSFRDTFYETGKPGLVLACWEVLESCK